MKVIHEPTNDSPFLVIVKEPHLPSAPLFEGDKSVLTLAAEKYPEILSVKGKKEVEYGLVHRIDTETSGLVLIATTQKSYDNLTSAQKNGEFEKWYRAEVDFIPDCAERLGGFPKAPSDIEKKIIVKSSFRPFGLKGREVRPVTPDSSRLAMKKGGKTLYETEISFESEGIAMCHIALGFRHQVRCHLAWCGFPVKDDLIYNPTARDKNSSIMKFTACRIDFPHPISGEVQSFSIPDLQM